MIELLDYCGVFAFAISGAALARRHGLDVIGVVTLAVVTGLAGGVIRDLLLGSVPPVALVDQWLLAVPVTAAIVTVVAPSLLQRLRRPVALFDTVGLGLFAAVGATKAVQAGLGIGAAVLVGSVAAVGGGMIRDLLVQQTPVVLTPASGLYVIPAGLGALLVAVGDRLAPIEQAENLYVISAAAVAVTMLIRLGSLVFGWRTTEVGRNTDGLPGTPTPEL